MVIIITAAVLVFAIAFFQVVQGVYSAVVMTLLSVFAAVVAINFYEPLAQSFLYATMPAYADATALMALFFIPLLVLRLLFDRFLRRNVVFGPWIDRLAGGVFGIVTGMILIGVLMICVQMLPFAESVLTYKPFDTSLRRQQRLAPLYPDEFVLSMAGTFSAGALQGECRFGRVHDDLLLEAFCARNTAGLNGGRVDAPQDAISVKGAYENDPKWAGWRSRTPDDPVADDADRIVMVEVAVNESARDEGGSQWSLVGTHFRLVCDSGRSCYPVAIRLPGASAPQFAEEKDDRAQVAKLAVRPKWVKGAKEIKIELFYRLRDSEKPTRMVFRRVATGAVKNVQNKKSGG